MMESQDLEPPRRSYKRPFSFKFKGTITGSLFLGFLLYRLLLPQPDPDCIHDSWQDLTHGLNRALVADPDAGSAYEGNSKQLSAGGKAFIGIGSLIMDIYVGALGINWLLRVKNMRSNIAAGLFFVTRATIFLNVCKFPFPKDMAWRSPGVFTMVVPYDHTRDFFQSGHTGTLTLIFLEFYTLKMKIPLYILVVCYLYEINVLVTCRCHYSIDIVGGLVWVCFWFWLVERYVIWFDKLLSLPYKLGTWVYLNTCADEEEIAEAAKKEDEERAKTTGRDSKGSDNIELVEVDNEKDLEGGSKKSDQLSDELEM